jgi:site-specific DNA-methyltransferase (adenine-specific)
MSLACNIQCTTADDLLRGLVDTSVDLIITDPPYGIGDGDRTAQYTFSEVMKAKNWQNFRAAWDVIPDYYAFTLDWMREAQRVLATRGNLLVFGTFIHNLHHIRRAVDELGMWCVQALHWCKSNPYPNMAGTQFTASTESVLVIRGSKKQSSYYDKTVAERYPLIGVTGEPLKNLRDYFVLPAETWVGATWKHPSRKPISLLQILIDAYTPKETSVLIVDPFAGSGSTGVAAWRVPGLHGSMFLGDSNMEYVDMMRQRMLQEMVA